MRRIVGRKRFLLAPAGAALAAVCFFLSWGRFSFLGLHKTVNGPEIGGAVWGTWVCSLLLLTGTLALLVIRRISWAHVLTMILTLAGFLFIGLRAAEAARGVKTPLGYVHPPKVGSISIGLGAAGTVLGLLLAFTGGILMILHHRRMRLEASTRR